MTLHFELQDGWTISPSLGVKWDFETFVQLDYTVKVAKEMKHAITLECCFNFHLMAFVCWMSKNSESQQKVYVQLLLSPHPTPILSYFILSKLQKFFLAIDLIHYSFYFSTEAYLFPSPDLIYWVRISVNV